MPISNIQIEATWHREVNGFVVEVPHIPFLNGYGKSLTSAQRRARSNVAEYFNIRKRMVHVTLKRR